MSVKKFRVQPSGCSYARKKQAKAWTLNCLKQTQYSSLSTQPFVYRCSQFGDLNASETLVNELTFRVIEKSCRQSAAPLGVDQLDGRFRIRKIQQVSGHLGMHLAQEFRNTRLDVRQIVQADRDKVQTFRTIRRIKLYQVRKFFAAWLAPGDPKVNQQRFGRFGALFIAALEQ